MSIPELSVVVPTYLGETSLRELVERTDAALAKIDYELIVVNDSSPDKTWQTLQELTKTHPRLLAVNLMKNVGQPLATLCGIAHASGRLIATMDDDLQHPPEELPALVDALVANPNLDAVVGAWKHDGSILRRLGTRVFALLTQIAYGAPRHLQHTAFRVIRRQTAEYMLEHTTRTPVISSLLFEITTRVTNVHVEHNQRPYGDSNFRMRDSIRVVLNNFFQASTLPLVFLSRLGLAVSGLSALLSLFFLLRWLFGVETPPGWASSFLATSFFSGFILFGIGLLGSYVDIVIREVRRPPRWAIRDVTRKGIDS